MSPKQAGNQPPLTPNVQAQYQQAVAQQPPVQPDISGIIVSFLEANMNNQSEAIQQQETTVNLRQTIEYRQHYE